jgi:hypothetical protein
MSRLARARRKLRHLHAIKRTARVRRRIAHLVTHIRYLKRLDFNGHPQNITHKLFPVIVLASKLGLVVTATTDGTHTPTSFHYPWNNADGLGHAVDFGLEHPPDQEKLERFQRAALHKFGAAAFLELFGPAWFYVKNGVRFAGPDPDNPNHVHVAR